MTHSAAQALDPDRPRLTRRSALRTGLLLGGAGLLAACSTPTSAGGGSGSAPAPAPESPSASGSPSASASTFTLDGQTTTELDALFDQVAKDSGIAGMGGAVWVGDQEWRRSAGYADLEKQTPFDPSVNIRIASITKSIVATAVLQLIDAGQLSFDDTLEKFVPGIANGTSITITNLLDMTSGIYEYTENAELNARWYANPTMPWSFGDTIALIKANKPMFAPGARMFYADSNYVILGEILAQVTGQPAPKVIADNVTGKLGLTRTFWPEGFSVPEPHPTAYVPTGLDTSDANPSFDNAASAPKIVNDVNGAVPAGSGAMIGTLDDLKVWGRELAVGSLLKPETQTRRLKTRRIEGVPINIGYGMGCERVNDFTGHNGAVYGYSSVVFCYPPADLVIAAVGNESNNNTTPTTKFVYAFIKQFFPEQWH